MSDVKRASRTRVRPASARRHARQERRSAGKSALAIAGGALAVVLAAVGGVAGVSAWQLSANIDQVTIDADSVVLPPMVGPYEGGFTMLIVGSDTRVGQGDTFGSESGGLNDVNMLLHVFEDQQSAVLVSIPRDLVVPIPACSDGGPALGQPINAALSYGGLDCVTKTVEDLTGLSIDFAGLITFRGVIAMSNAIGGVEVCTTGPIMDAESGLKIRSAGTHTLEGSQALAFLRTRKQVGDGSDLSRLSTQQVFLSSLVRKIKSEDTLGDPATVYRLAQAATKNMTLSRNLSRLDVLASLALALKDIPLDRIVMVQYPSRTGVTTPAYYTDKAAPIPELADALFEALRNDQLIALDDDALDNRDAVTTDPNAPEPEEPEPGATASASPSDSPSPDSPSPAVTLPGGKGQTADQHTCAVPY